MPSRLNLGRTAGKAMPGDARSFSGDVDIVAADPISPLIRLRLKFGSVVTGLAVFLRSGGVESAYPAAEVGHSSLTQTASTDSKGGGYLAFGPTDASADVFFSRIGPGRSSISGANGVKISHALDAESLSVGTNRTEFTVDTSGNVAVAGTLAVTGAVAITTSAVIGASAALAALTLRRDNGASLPVLNDVLISLNFNGNRTTSSNFSSGAQIQAIADGAWSGSSAPGRLALLTTPSGSLSGAIRVLIDNAGKVYFGSSTSAATWIDQSGNALFAGTVGITGVPTFTAVPVFSGGLGSPSATALTITGPAATSGTTSPNPALTISSVATSSDPTETIYQFKTTTSNATANQILGAIDLPSGTAIAVDVVVLGYYATGDNPQYYRFTAAFRHGAQVGATTTLIGVSDDGTWGVPNLAYVSNQCQIRVTGKAATTIVWQATAHVWANAA